MTVIDHRYAPYRVWTCIARPDDPHKTLVDETGGLLYGFRKDPARIETYRFARRIDVRVQGDRPILEHRQWTESARLPIVVTELVFAGQTLRLEAAGHADDAGLRSDVVRWTIRVHDDAPESLLTGIWLQIQDERSRVLPAGSARSRFAVAVRHDEVPPVGSLMEMFQPRPTVETVPVDAEVVLVSDRPMEPASSFDFGPSSSLRPEPTLVEKGGRLEGAFVVPIDLPVPEHFGVDEADAAFERERRFWNGLPALDLPIEVGDRDLQDMLVASVRNILQARERRDGRVEFQVGPTIYRGVWVVDTYFFLEAARYLGLDADTDEGLDALMSRARDDGAIEEMDFHYKETGIALATVVRQARMKGDLKLLPRYWATVERAVGYIRRRIDESLALPADAPNQGLLPASMADGGAGGMRPEYTTGLWTWVGLDAVASAARELGLNDAGAGTAADRLRERLMSARERDLARTSDGIRYWPQVMPGSGNHHWIADHEDVPGRWRALNPGSATWALAQAIYPGEAFSPDHDVVQDFCDLMDAIDNEEGIPAETGWLPHHAVWSYAASFSAHVWLYAGRPDKAVDYLYAFVNHASATRTWREEQSFRATRNGQIFGDMPHNWASVELVRWVRNLLAFETQGELRLLAGAPEAWLAGNGVRLQRSATRFGHLDLHARRGDGALHVDAALTRHKGAPAPTRVRILRPTSMSGPVFLNGERIEPERDVAELIVC